MAAKIFCFHVQRSARVMLPDISNIHSEDRQQRRERRQRQRVRREQAKISLFCNDLHKALERKMNRGKVEPLGDGYVLIKCRRPTNDAIFGRLGKRQQAVIDKFNSLYSREAWSLVSIRRPLSTNALIYISYGILAIPSILFCMTPLLMLEMMQNISYDVVLRARIPQYLVNNEVFQTHVNSSENS